MSITYRALWQILDDRKMSKKELKERAGVSHTTMALMTQDKPVSLDTLERICRALQCDIGDVVCLSSEVQALDREISSFVMEMNDPDILLRAVSNYLQKNGMSRNAFVRMTGISSNTLQRVMDCKPINLSTYKKLMPFIDVEVMRVVDGHG